MAYSIPKPPNKRPKGNSDFPHRCRHDRVIAVAPTGIPLYQCIRCGEDAPVSEWNMAEREIVTPVIPSN